MSGAISMWKALTGLNGLSFKGHEVGRWLSVGILGELKGERKGCKSMVIFHYTHMKFSNFN